MKTFQAKALLCVPLLIKFLARLLQLKAFVAPSDVKLLKRHPKVVFGSPIRASDKFFFG